MRFRAVTLRFATNLDWWVRIETNDFSPRGKIIDMSKMITPRAHVTFQIHPDDCDDVWIKLVDTHKFIVWSVEDQVW